MAVNNCAKCKQVILGQATLVNVDKYHFQCFECFNCKRLIGDKPFYQRKAGIFCVVCYQSMYVQRCINCLKAIKSHGVRAMDVFWHAKCFRCKCRVQLIERYFINPDDPNKPVCAKCNEKYHNDRLEALMVLPAKE